MKEESDVFFRLLSLLWDMLKAAVVGAAMGRILALGTENDKMDERIQALEAATCEQHSEPAALETCACAGETP